MWTKTWDVGRWTTDLQVEDGRTGGPTGKPIGSVNQPKYHAVVVIHAA